MAMTISELACCEVANCSNISGLPFALSSII